MTRSHIVSAALAALLFASPASAQNQWEWPGEAWADWTAFLGPITQEVKDNCQAILSSPAGQARIGWTGAPHQRGRMGMFGDSITVTGAYMTTHAAWCYENNQTGVDYGCDYSFEASGNYSPNVPSGIVDEWLDVEWLRDGLGKGGAYSNDSGWTIEDSVERGHPARAVDQVGYSNPPGDFSWAIIMYGTNDVSQMKFNWHEPGIRQAWKQSYLDYVQSFIDLGVIPVVSTIPPRHTFSPVDGTGFVEMANQIILEVADEKKIPYVDLYALIDHYMDPPWTQGLMSSDGVHLSANPSAKDFSQSALTSTNGYGARSKLSMDMAMKMRDIVFLDGPAEDSVGPPPPSCLRVLDTNPQAGGDWDASSDFFLFLTQDPDVASFASRVSASGSSTGAFTVQTTGSSFSVGFSVSPAPQDGETITFTIADGARGSSGDLLDGDGDGDCGGAYSVDVVADVGGGGGGDTSPPAQVLDLRLAFNDAGYPVATWTVPTDDVGVTRVEIRTDVLPAGGTFDWDEADPAGVPTPGSSGAVQQYSLDLIDARAGVLHMALRVEDAAGNVSPVSNVARDVTGPEVLRLDAGEPTVSEGEVHLVPILVSDAARGTSAVSRLRYRFDAETPAEARFLDLTPVDGDVAVGIAQVPVSAIGWSAGETHGLVVEGQDAAGNWSPEVVGVPITVTENVPIPDCFALDEVWPAPDTPREELSNISLVFSREVDATTVGSSSVVLEREGQSAQVLADYQWLVQSRVLQLTLPQPVTEEATFTLTILPAVTDNQGIPFQSGGDCTGDNTVRFLVVPDDDPVGGPGLDELDENGRIQVDAFTLQLSELVPGDTLRIYDTAGRLLHSQPVDASEVTVDTRKLGSFSARILVVAYREHRQLVVVDGSTSYGSYLE